MHLYNMKNNLIPWPVLANLFMLPILASGRSHSSYYVLHVPRDSQNQPIAETALAFRLRF